MEKLMVQVQHTAQHALLVAGLPGVECDCGEAKTVGPEGRAADAEHLLIEAQSQSQPELIKMNVDPDRTAEGHPPGGRRYRR